jgi:hypothetical protein
MKCVNEVVNYESGIKDYRKTEICPTHCQVTPREERTEDEKTDPLTSVPYCRVGLLPNSFRIF